MVLAVSGDEIIRVRPGGLVQSHIEGCRRFGLDGGKFVLQQIQVHTKVGNGAGHVRIIHGGQPYSFPGGIGAGPVHQPGHLLFDAVRMLVVGCFVEGPFRVG